MIYVHQDSVVARKEGIVASEMDGETVMMNLETGKYYNLGGTGSAIWKIIVNPIKVNEIIGELVEKYSTTQEQCIQDVLPFLQNMVEQGLITVA